jgi:hypothetical protein
MGEKIEVLVLSPMFLVGISLKNIMNKYMVLIPQRAFRQAMDNFTADNASFRWNRESKVKSKQNQRTIIAQWNWRWHTGSD